MRFLRWLTVALGLGWVGLVMVGAWTPTPLRLEAAGMLAGTPIYLPSVLRSSSAPTGTPLPTGTSLPTATVSIPVTGSSVFAVGAGGSDAVPRQVVRAANDRVYLFAAAQYSPLIRVYRSKVIAPASAADFDAAISASESEIPLSLDAAYGGANLIFVIVNTRSGNLKVYPFDIALNAFLPARTLTSNSAVVSGEYVGTQGISALVDPSGQLQIAYWAVNNQIIHRAYTYAAASNTWTLSGAAQRVDTAGSANHPALALSPLDGSLTVAWVSEAAAPAGKILARTRSAAGVWGSIETVSTADVWTSTSAGINIDQGPALLIGADGARHVTYIQDYETYNGRSDYGRLHYAVKSGAAWVDTAFPYFSHAPTLGLTSAGTLYLIGHGHPNNLSGPCLSMDDMCFQIKTAGGSWSAPQLLLSHTPGQSFTSFDSSPSVKWSVVGWNRPEMLEFVFFGVPVVNGSFNYSAPTLYYARLP